MPSSYCPSFLSGYFPSRYEHQAERLSRPKFADYNSGMALPTYYSREHSTLLPITNIGHTRGILDGWKDNVWAFRDDKLATAKAGFYNPLFLPTPADYNRPIPLPSRKPSGPFTFNPFGASDDPPRLQQTAEVQTARHIREKVIVAPLAPVRARQVSRYGVLPTPVVRHSKRSIAPIPSEGHIRDQNHSNASEDGTRKRVRFSAGVPTCSKADGQVNEPIYKAPSASDLLPFADWVAHRCHSILATNITNPWLMTLEQEAMTSKRIANVLRKWFPKTPSDDLLAPRTALLALWYMERLFCRGIFSPHDVQSVGAPEAVIRTFLLCFTFADKWLNDSPRPIKDWQRFCTMPPRACLLAEKTALMMLSYNITVTKPEWAMWLSTIKISANKYVSPCSGGMTAAAVIQDIVRKDTADSGTGLQYHPLVREEISVPHLLEVLRDHLLRSPQKA